jgi:hypothetical protein
LPDGNASTRSPSAGRTCGTGYAGVGKTVVLQVITIILLTRRQRVVLCALTHQAVAVPERKLKGAPDA